ncbi:MAG: large conductance mechanosensitive channel protein MscL [Flavobacteriales bacterium]|jgi:large conductance mechanosensitive channel
MGFVQEFKEFAAKGNVVDLAVGVIIGGAFGKITTSLVEDVLNPVLTLLTDSSDLTRWTVVLRPERVGEAGEVIPAVALRVGAFLQSGLDFVLIALAMFLVVKAMNRLR